MALRGFFPGASVAGQSGAVPGHQWGRMGLGSSFLIFSLDGYENAIPTRAAERALLPKPHAAETGASAPQRRPVRWRVAAESRREDSDVRSS